MDILISDQHDLVVSAPELSPFCKVALCTLSSLLSYKNNHSVSKCSTSVGSDRYQLVVFSVVCDVKGDLAWTASSCSLE